MGLADRIDFLKDKHQALKSAVEAEHHRIHPDELEIAALKKQKLAIKDEIVQLSAS